MAAVDSRIAETHEDMLKDCAEFLAFQGGLVSFFKVLVYVSLLFVLYRTASSFYKGDLATGVRMLLGVGTIAIAVFFISDLLAVMRNFV